MEDDAFQKVALAYEKDLSGVNGPEARFNALREIITSEINQFDEDQVVTSPDGDVLVGGNGFKILETSPRQRIVEDNRIDVDVPTLCGFRIRRVDERFVEVFGGVISGLGLSEVTPAPLTVDEWTKFSVSENSSRQFYITFDFVPNAVEREDSSEENTVYAIGSGGTVTSATFEMGSSLPSHVRPEVAPSSGSKTNGKYHMKVGSALREGGIFQERCGPFSINFCAPDTFLLHV